MNNILVQIGRWFTGFILRPALVRRAEVTEATLNDLLEMAADAIITINSHQTIVRFNRGAETIFGYKAGDVIGQPVDILLPERFAQVHRKHVRGFALGSETARLMGERTEIVGRRKGGTEFPAEASISKLTHAKQLYMTVILRDVSERKQTEAALRDSEERFRRVFNYSYDAIFLIDPANNRVMDANPKACALFGFTHDEFLARHVGDICPQNSRQFEVFVRSVIQQGTGWTDELVCQSRPGEELPVEVSASIVDFDDQRLMIALFRDIRERKAVERMREAFVSNVSHELRTPIANIKLNTYLLKRDPEKQEIYMNRLARETDRLNHIVEDLLRLSRLDQAGISVEAGPMDLNALIAQYADDRTPLAENQQLTLVLDLQPDLPTIQADEGLLGQVLSILLTNAFTYTPAGGCVTIQTLSIAETGRTWIGFRVSDTGPGIPPHELPFLFDRFFRGKTALEHGIHGTGLGLAIAHEIVQRHQGRIEAASSGVPGEGAGFTVWLPG